MDLSVDLAPRNTLHLYLANPVMVASGTFGYGTEYAGLIDVQRLGAIISKGTTLKPREGNPQPRLAETPCGLLNAIGLQNIGVEALIKEKAPIWASWRVPVIVNIAGDTITEYAQLASMLSGVAGIAGLEINISCPNVKAGGAEFGSSPKLAYQVVSAVRKKTKLPLLVKLTPNTSDIAQVAVACEEAGADGISIINTIKGMAIDIKKRRPLLGNITGGLSGPAIKPVALYMVYEVAGRVNIPVVGVGGISSSEDAIEFLMAGATAIQVGTANLSRPQAALEILEGLEEFMMKEGLSDISQIIGAAR